MSEYARNTDPETSHLVADAFSEFRGSQKDRLLIGHGNRVLSHGPRYGGMQADEAWASAGGDVCRHPCYWHRHGDLIQDHYLNPVRDENGQDVTRAGASGHQRRVLEITQEGLARYRELMGY